MAVWVHDEHSEEHPSPAQGEKKMRPPGRARKHPSPRPKHADTRTMEPAGPTSVPWPTPLCPFMVGRKQAWQARSRVTQS